MFGFEIWLLLFVNFFGHDKFVVHEGMYFGGLFNHTYRSLSSTFSFLLLSQIVMSPHEQAEEFVDHYLCIMQGAGDMDPGNFQKILEMKVRPKTS